MYYLLWHKARWTRKPSWAKSGIHDQAPVKIRKKREIKHTHEVEARTSYGRGI